MRTIIGGVALIILGLVVFVSVKTYLTTQRVALPPTHDTTAHQRDATVSQHTTQNTPSVADTLARDADGITTILLLGVDKRPASEGGAQRTDTIMLARIHRQRGKIALLSLPRDLYVYDTPQGGAKINALYDRGLRDGKGAQYIVRAVERVTGVRIHYVIAANFAAFTAVVDALGGINVLVERPINDTRYPGPNYSYETFTLAAGLQHLDGATALKYVRSRHDDPDGDFGRAKRQQQVLQAIKNKAFSIGTFTNVRRINALLNAIGDNLRTDLRVRDIHALITLLTKVDTQNIVTVVVDAWRADSLLRATHVGRAFALVPRAGRTNYTEIHTLAEEIFDLPARARLQQEVRREAPRIVIKRAGASRETAQRVRATIMHTIGAKYDIPIIATQQRTTTHAAITDMSSGTKPFTLTALRRALGAAHTTDTRNAHNDDFVVTLGTDADAFFAPPPVTQEEFDRTVVQ